MNVAPQACRIANLELEGYVVVEARDGGEAIKLIGEQAFDLIVSDVVMPAWPQASEPAHRGA